MATSVQMVVDSVIDNTETGTESEYFRAKVSVPSGASDQVVYLGSITDPVFLAVLGAKGISFKLDSGGTDAIGAYPMALIMDNDGLGFEQILVSNDDGQSHEITIVAAE